MAKKFERGGKNHMAPLGTMARFLLAVILPILVCAAAGELHADSEALSQSVPTGICVHICLRRAKMQPYRSLIRVGI